jgi:hypothetical protein
MSKIHEELAALKAQNEEQAKQNAEIIAQNAALIAALTKLTEAISSGNTAQVLEDNAEPALDLEAEKAKVAAIQQKQDAMPVTKTCGRNLEWNLEDGVLSVKQINPDFDSPRSKAGRMDDFPPNGAPWAAFKDEITEVVLAEGVDNVGQHAFTNCPNLKTINLPETVSHISHDAFNNCPKITEVELPESVTVIGSGAFENCTSLETINFPDGLENIRRAAFENCTALEIAEVPETCTVHPNAFDGRFTVVERFEVAPEALFEDPIEVEELDGYDLDME